MDYQCPECRAKWVGLPGQIYCVVCSKIIVKDVNNGSK